MIGKEGRGCFCGAVVGGLLGAPKRVTSGDIDGADGEVGGDPVGDANGDFDEVSVEAPDTDTVGATVFPEETLTGDLDGAAYNLFTTPRERNKLSILP